MDDWGSTPDVEFVMPILAILAAILFMSLLFKPAKETAERLSRQDRKRYEDILKSLLQLWQEPSHGVSFNQIQSAVDKLNAPDATFQHLYDKSLDLVEHHRNHKEGRSIG